MFGDLDAWAAALLADIPGPRILFSGHDAFGYFGHNYDLEVRATDLISTGAILSATELSELADYIVEHEVPVIFQDNQANPQAVTSLQEAVEARGWTVTVSTEELFADSLGPPPRWTPTSVYSDTAPPSSRKRWPADARHRGGGRCPGSFAYLRRQSLISDAISHSALPGILIAFLTLTALRLPGRGMWGLIIGATATGMAVVLSSFFGLGILIMQHIQNSPFPGKSGIQDHLFGNPSTLTRADLTASLVTGGLVLAVMALL